MDREKVIKGLEVCSDVGFCETIKKYDLRCPYRNNDGKGCDRSQLMMDALALLKQEAVVRCKDCLFGEQINDRYICTNAGHCQSKSNEPDWFCADGERKFDTLN